MDKDSDFQNTLAEFQKSFGYEVLEAKPDEVVEKWVNEQKTKNIINEVNSELQDEGRFTLVSYQDDKKDEYVRAIKIKQSICFLGECGSGKTHIASALCRALIVDGYSAHKITDFDFGLEIEGVRFSPYDIKDKIKILKHCDLLFFDDVGKTPIFDKGGKHNFYGRILFDIFDYRANHAKKKNIVTAGFYEKHKLYEHLKKELYRRMFCNGDVDFFELKQVAK